METKALTNNRFQLSSVRHILILRVNRAANYFFRSFQETHARLLFLQFSGIKRDKSNILYIMEFFVVKIWCFSTLEPHAAKLKEANRRIYYTVSELEK